MEAGTQVIVVGGGLSGLSAAHTVLEHGGRVLLLEKNSFLGGNSTKATSGINAALSNTQIQLGIKDSVELFYEDTAKSARELIRPPLVEVLTGKSAAAVEWLQSKFKIDLSQVSRLGGHSQPRTHRGKERFPGMTITYALLEQLEHLAASQPHRVTILNTARATRLLTHTDSSQEVHVIGVEYEHEGKTVAARGAVILTTGGYAADYAADGLLKLHRPELHSLPTTNGDWSTGDGLKMTAAIGGSTIDLDKVQVHPTGLVDPNEPDAKVKFLAAEALRGVGGILLDNSGNRFCDELGHRDYVTGEMWKHNKPPYRLVLNTAAAKELEWHCKHYMGRGLMKKYPTGSLLAADMHVSPQALEATFTAYNQAAVKGVDQFGKKFFHNTPVTLNDEFYVSVVTPVVHFCMGGVQITPETQVMSPKGVIHGLYAAGEVSGGVHGVNRLGGSSLLACVVFGRQAGHFAAKYLLQQLSQNSNNLLQHLSNNSKGNVPQVSINISPQLRKLSVQVHWDTHNAASVSIPVPPSSSSSSSSTSSASPSAASSASPSSTSSAATCSSATTSTSTNSTVKREYSAAEVAVHNKENDCWEIVNGAVLDVTEFLKDHPGGKKAILLYAGKDATAEFNMLHKPDVIQKYAPNAVIGSLKPDSTTSSTASSSSSSTGVYVRKETPGLVGSRSGGTADVLPMERAKASFEVEQLTNVLDGGVEGTKKRRFILSPITRHGDKVMDVNERYYWDSQQLLKQHVSHFIGVHEAFWEGFRPSREDYVWMMESAVFSGSLMNHYGLFLPTIEMHASDEQKLWWHQRTMQMKTVGCYAQTELGHGSNVRGLMTTATYDKKTQEFVLNTPTLRSMKWWPGTLGKVATHALVYAQLLIDDKEYGVHAFMCQIRDEQHRPLPGIELGDLGPKLGDHANDTGYMRLDNVKIPREFLLSRFQQVTRDGQYVRSEKKKSNEKLGYTTMIFTRGTMVKAAGGFLARAVTIAIRYSCVRKQGFVNSQKGISYKSAENQLIDYQVQRYRLFKQLAISYAIKFTGSWLLNSQSLLSAEAEKLGNLEAFFEVAATSSGLKALCTFLAWQGIEDCRKCCGGNGYLMASGIAPLAANYVWQITAEGDWIILMLQTARFLLKSLQSAVQGELLAAGVNYLEPLKDPAFQPVYPSASSVKDVMDLEYLQKVFRWCALVTVINVGKEFQQRLADCNGNFNEALNACALELINAVKAHSYAFLLANFVQTINGVEDAAVKAALSKVAMLFAVSSMNDDPQWNGLILTQQLQFIKAAVVELLNLLRADAVALVDAFDFPDRILNSAIGSKDGNVYEALYEAAVNSPLNQKEPFEGYHEVLRPHLDLEFLKAGNSVPNRSKL